MSIRKKDIEKLIQLVEQSTLPIAEIEISDDEGTIKIKTANSNGRVLTTHHVEHSSAPVQSPNSDYMTEKLIKSPNHSEKQEELAHSSTEKVVKAIMVGTAYLTPSPNAKPFVEVGQVIAVGDTLCLIEAMKMFNKVEAEIAGVVKKCYITNGQPIEFDQPLFLIDTSNRG